MTIPNRPSVFIEKIFPVKLLNEQVYYEHGGNPFKGLHRWYSRKPLSFSRAAVLGSILPADISIEEFEYLLGLYSEGEFEFWRKKALSKEELEKIRDGGTVKLYKTPPTEKQVKRVHDLCEEIWGKRTPAILDPFAGGGSIPFEAARYGLEVFASDLNPVAVVTMKAALEYPLKFGPELQADIDKWVKWVGDEAEKRLAEFFPSQEGETVQNYLWAHTVVCPHCQSVIPLSPNWWLSKTSNYAGKGQERKVTQDWYAVKPIPNLAEKRVDFELIKGKKGKGTTIIYNSVVQASSLNLVNSSKNLVNSSNIDNVNVGDIGRQDVCLTGDEQEYNPDEFTTIARGVGKCCNCGNVIEDEQIKIYSSNNGFGHQLYAVAFKKGKENLSFRIPNKLDLEGVSKADKFLQEKYHYFENLNIIPSEPTSTGLHDSPRNYEYGLRRYEDCFNLRQLLILVTYLEIINDVKVQLKAEQDPEKVKAISTYLSLVMDRCVDRNSRLGHWHSSRAYAESSMAQHALNLNWNYPETAGNGELWEQCADAFTSDYTKLCEFFNHLVGQTSSLPISSSQHSSISQQFSLNINNIEQQSITDGTGWQDANDGTGWQDASPTEGKLIQTEINSKDLKMRRRRLPHWELDGSVYFITFNTWEKLELPPQGRQISLDCCLFFNNQRYTTYAVVVMPDHVHWLMQPLPKHEQEYWSLSSILQSIKSYSSKQIGKAINHIGVLWQDEYYDRIIRDDREFLETWNYIRNNPVKAGLADYPENYPFFWQTDNLSPDYTVGQTSSLPNISSTLPDVSSSLANVSSSLPNVSEKDMKDGIGWQDASPTDDSLISSTKIIGGSNINVNLESADTLYHIPNNSIDAIITDPPYYGTIQYAELSDFFYVWQKRVLGDIFPDLFWQELTDKDREAVANPSRFRNMGESPDELAKRDYEAKMSMAWSEAYRVLRPEGVLTVQFNHKDSGAWDTLAKALIDAGFEITASWAVSTENPQNLHQAKKNSVSSTVILVCRKRDPHAPQAWWDDLRPEVANIVEQRAPDFEANDITGIDLYLSAFGPALNVFSRAYPILDNSGAEVRPEVAFAEARKAVASYRFQQLVQTDTAGFDPLTQWYLLAWDAFKAREFPFDEAQQLALAIGGFNISELTKTHWLIEAKSGSCSLLTPQQRLKKRAFSVNPQDFSAAYLVNALHAVLAIYEEEANIIAVRQFMQKTGLADNNYFTKTLEIALKVIPAKVKEQETLLNLCLGIKPDFTIHQPQLF